MNTYINRIFMYIVLARKIFMKHHICSVERVRVTVSVSMHQRCKSLKINGTVETWEDFELIQTSGTFFKQGGIGSDFT